MFRPCCCFFFFNDTATTEIYTLSLHDALPIYSEHILHAEADSGPVVSLHFGHGNNEVRCKDRAGQPKMLQIRVGRSEEHTSELQSQSNLVCRLLLEKKKINCYCFCHMQAYDVS